MSPAFNSGVEKHFAGSYLTFGKFHILKSINEAVDDVRRQEQTKVTRSGKGPQNPINIKEHQVAILAHFKLIIFA